MPDVHEATAAALLDVERRAIFAIRSVIQTTPKSGPMIAVSRDLGAVVADVLHRARGAARQTSTERLRAEWDAALADASRLGFAVDGGPVPAKMPADADRLASERTARLYTDSLLKDLERAVDNEERVTMAELASRQERAVETAAAWEVASAFNDQRLRNEKVTRQQYEGRNWLPVMVATWDARLDVRTCPRCRKLDGETRPLGLDFEGGVAPGKIHAKCRCVRGLIASLIYIGRKEKVA